ncbi:MAG: BsuPI-related putative proteinase inhibitor [Chthoniobacterales bacterium]
MMKKFAVPFAYLLLSACFLQAQHPEVSPTPENKGPYLEKSGSYRPEEIVTPRAVPTETVATQMKSFFKDMFKSVKLGGIKGSYVETELKVEPTDVVLADKRELTVTLSVINKTGKMLRLEFPTTQRLEILLRDSTGKVIERWSEDRSFGQTSGIVVINPKERIQYAERIATREMKPEQKYTVEASISNHPEYSRSVAIRAK